MEKRIKNFNNFVNESFSSLTDEEKSHLQIVVDKLKGETEEKIPYNSEVANPRGKAKNPFYDRGSRKLDGLGKSFASIVPGTVNKKGDVITAEVSHGVEFESGLKTENKTLVEMDKKTFEYTTKKIETNL